MSTFRQSGTRGAARFGFALILILCTASSLLATNSPYRVPKIKMDMSVDGVLDEPFWEDALSLSLDFEVRPGENIPPPVKTIVKLAYSESHLYAAFIADDPDPSKIRARFTDRDQLLADDWVALNLDTFNDERRSFLLVCNPFGIQADNIEDNGNGSSWDAIWASAGQITDKGYQVEIKVPFSSLGFQRSDGEQVWGFDAIRSYPRNVRHHIALFERDRDNNCYLCQAVKLVGFDGATPGKNIEIIPTFSSLYAEERFEPNDSTSWQAGSFERTSPGFGRSLKEGAGFTARWGITPNINLLGTYNPDFSQVESDATQLDINTNFALSYPERRPFFLEGADFFHTRLDVVHTRSLADPIAGVKLSGKEGSREARFQG